MSENRWKAPCKRIHRSRTYSTIVASQTSSLPDIFITLSKWLFYCRSSAFQCASFQGQKIERVMIVVSQTYTTWPESCSSLSVQKNAQNTYKDKIPLKDHWSLAAGRESWQDCFVLSFSASCVLVHANVVLVCNFMHATQSSIGALLKKWVWGRGFGVNPQNKMFI